MPKEKAGVAIAGNNLVSFSAAMSSQEREDVLDLLLYADFFASQTYDRRVLWKSWLDYYRNRLVKYGCSLKCLIMREPVVITDPYDLDRLTFKIVGEEGSPELANLAQASFSAMRINQYAREFLEHGTGKGRAGGFQIVPCEKTADGEIEILLCAFQANALEVVDEGWFWDTSVRDLVFRVVGGAYAFSSDRYAPYRDEIRTKLTQGASRRIQDLEI